MRKAVLIAVSVTLFVMGVSAQQSGNQRANIASRAATSASSDAAVSGPMIAAGSQLTAELQKSLDVKTAKVGDEIVLKTKSAIKQGSEVIVPKGSRLIGRVTDVAQRSKGNQQSRLGMVFDRIEGKGLAQPITATIVTITDVRTAAAAGDVFAADAGGSSSTRTRTSSGSGGGLLGGGVLGSATGAVGGVLNTTTNTVGSVAGTATQTVSGTTQALGGTLRGISISNSSAASAGGSTTLSSNDRNVRLEKGVTFNLLVSGSVNE